MKDIIQIALMFMGGAVFFMLIAIILIGTLGPAISWLWDRRYRTWLFQLIEARHIIGLASWYVEGEMWEKLYELVDAMDRFTTSVHPKLVAEGRRPKSGGLFMKDYLLLIKAVKDLDGYKEWLANEKNNLYE